MHYHLIRKSSAFQLKTVVVFVVSVYVLTFCIVLPVVCRHLVYSPYFIGTKNNPEVVKQVVMDNYERYAAAQRFFTQEFPSLSHEDHEPTPLPPNQLDLAIGIISVNRDKPLRSGGVQQALGLGYLTQTAAKLLQVLHEVPLSYANTHRRIFLCNVDAQPHLFTEAQTISKFIPTVSRFANMTGREKGIRDMDVFDKEKDDYAFCLDVAKARFNSRYVLLLEDDILLGDTVFDVLSSLMRRSQLDGRRDWLFVKLYYPQKWQGFANELETVLELIAVAFIGGSFTVGLASLVSKQLHCRIPARTFDVWWFAVGATYFVLFCIAIGRPYIFSWRRYFVSTHRLASAPDCCTQAVLYPTSVVADLSAHLRRVRCSADFSVDIAIDGYARLHGLHRYLVDPNVLQHIGLVSTVRDYSKSAEQFL